MFMECFWKLCVKYIIIMEMVFFLGITLKLGWVFERELGIKDKKFMTNNELEKVG